jgi:hypothetical protein
MTAIYAKRSRASLRILRISTSMLLSAALVLGGSPAFADSPSTWNSGPSRSVLENIIFFGGSVVGLIVVITLFALLTARNNFVPEPPEPGSEVDHSHH